MTKRIESDRIEAFEWKRFLDLPLRELRCLLNEKQRSTFRSLNWLSLSDKDIKVYFLFIFYSKKKKKNMKKMEDRRR